MERSGLVQAVVLPFVLVMIAAVVLLRGLDWLPEALGAEPRGIRRYDSIAAVESKTGRRVRVPAFFPDTLAWPPARIRLVLAPPVTVGLTFVSRSTRTENLIVCETLDGPGRIPSSLLADGLLLQATDISVAGRPATLARISLDDGLVVLKDTPFETYSETELRDMQQRVRDKHYRIFADRECVYVFNRDTFLRGRDPRALFADLDVPDPGHAFYLGGELERAALAVRLGKKYTQESPLRWGYLDATTGAGAEPS